MGSRSGGGNRGNSYDQGPQIIGQDPVDWSDSFPGPFRAMPRWMHRYAGGDSSLSAQPNRQVTVSNTAWGSVVPQVYGETKVIGTIAHRQYNTTSNQEIWGILLSYGRQGQEALSALPNAPTFSGEAVPSYIVGGALGIFTHNGDGDEDNVSDLLKDAPGWTAARTTRWSKRAHLVVRIDKSDENFTQEPIIECVLPGATFTSFGTHTALDSHTNPIDVCYDIHQDAEAWKGDLTSRLDDGAGGTWEEWQSWCDDVMSDGSKRYSFCGAIYDQDPEEAITRILSHCMAEIVPDENTSLRIWGEKPPPPLSELCTEVAGNVLIFDADVSAEIAVGEYGFLSEDGETHWADYGVLKVYAVIGASVAVTQVDGSAVSITCTDAKFHRLQNGGLRLELSDMHKLGHRGTVNAAELADVVRVNWTPPEDLGEYFEDGIYSAGTEDIKHEVTLSQCRLASMAQRWAYTRVQIEHGHRFRWEGYVAKSKAETLQVGDLFLFHDGGSDYNIGRLHPPRIIRYKDGLYELPKVIQFVGSVFSDAVATEPTIAASTGTSGSNVTNLPSSVDQCFSFSGGWNDYTQGGDPDDLTDDPTWWDFDDLSFSYNGTYSTLETTATGGITSAEIDWSGYSAPPARMLVAFLWRTNSAFVDAGSTVLKLSYYARTAGPSVEYWSHDMPMDASDQAWKVFVAAVDVNVGDTYHRLQFQLTAGDGTFPDLLDIRSMYWVAWGNQPNLAILERFTYTEHASANDTIDQYQIWRPNTTGPGSVITSVNQGIDSIEANYIGASAIIISPAATGSQFKLRAMGINSAVVDVDVDTQSVTEPLNVGELKSNRDVDVSGKADGSIAGIDTDAFTQIYDTPTGWGLAETDTAESFTALDVGDVSGGDYHEFDVDGITRLHGDARAWDDLRVSLDAAKVPSINGPSWVQVKDDGSGSTGVYAWHFDDGENIYFNIQMPHDWDEGTDIFPHLHWCPTTDVDPSDNIGLEFEYTWSDINETFGNTTVVTRDVPTGVNAAYDHLVNNFAASGISGTGHTISSVLICRFSREAAASDNYAGQIVALYVDVHYQKDSFGSDTATSKT